MAHGYTAWTVSGSALEAAGHCGPATQAAGPKDAELRAGPERPADFQEPPWPPTNQIPRGSPSQQLRWEQRLYLCYGF